MDHSGGVNKMIEDDPWDSPDNYWQVEGGGLVMKSATEVYQNDVRDLLIACGLPYHARSESPHEVVWREILPAIRRLRKGAGRGSF